MKNEKLGRILSYVLVAILSVTVTVAIMLGIFIYQQGNSKLAVMESLIRHYFIGDVDQAALEDAAAQAMVGALGDRWSYYIPADQYAAYMEQMNNAYVGVGITITPEENGGILVLDVMDGGPAEEAGIQAKDIIIQVDDRPILGLSLDEIRSLVLGEENTTVRLTFLRNGEEMTVSATRRAIRTPVVQGQMLENHTAYVAILNFNRNCASEASAIIEELVSQGAQKFIFDVRDNPGGYASELVKVLDYLLPEGEIFTTVDYAGNTNTKMSDAKCLDLPMAVLVNGNTYSAAEFFAAAMSEYDAAVIVGEKTIGKGYFQNTFQLADGSVVGLSTGKYYTPKGESLAGVGVIPDISVALENEQVPEEPLQDAQILAAHRALNP